MKRLISFLITAFLCLYGLSNDSVKVFLNDNYILEFHNFSGNGQTLTIGNNEKLPLRVYVTDRNNKAVANHELEFAIYNKPENAADYKLEKHLLKTDSLGIATNYFQIGDLPGEYRIIVKSAECSEANILVYSVYGREKSWIVFLLIGLVGGLAIFLYGLDIMSKGMQASAGNKMRSLIGKLTYNRFFALLSGIIITVMLQSSSAASVMLVGFVQAGLMSFIQSLGILLGAGIGTTITAQLIAMNIAEYSLLIIAMGFAVMILSRKTKINNIGKSILGCGLLFFGMMIMSEAMFPLRSYEGFINFLINLENPILGILIGFIFTALIQSSAAFIGIMITLASQGLISLEASIPLVLGTNLGTGMTAIIASLNSGREAKKVALAHTLFKGIGVLIFIFWIPEFADLLRFISGANSDASIINPEILTKQVPRQIANAHTVFSISLALLLLPFTNLIARFINWILPVIPEKTGEVFELKHINMQVTNSPAMAMSLAKKETERMSENVLEMLKMSIKPFLYRDFKVLEELQKKENKIDFLKENINKYLITVSSENSDEDRLHEAFQIMYVVKELEMIADIVNTNLRHQANKWLSSDSEFSDEGKDELQSLHLKAMKQISRSMDVFHNLNLEKALKVKHKLKKYTQLSDQYEKMHYSRLIQKYDKSLSSSEVHLELIGLYNAVIRHATNISRIFLHHR